MRAWLLGCGAALLVGCGQGAAQRSPEANGSSNTSSPPIAFVTVAITGDGSGRVTSSPQGIDCPGLCSALFPSGISVTLSATPDASSTVKGYSTGCAGPTCTLGVTGNVIVQVELAAVPAQPSRPADRCAGIVPPRDVPMQQHVVPFEPLDGFYCGVPAGDASGQLAFPIQYSHVTRIDVVSASDGATQQVDSGWMNSTPFQQPQGFFSLGEPYLGPCADQLGLEGWTIAGTPAADRLLWAAGHFAAVSDPNGGLFIAGALNPSTCSSDAPLSPLAVMFQGGATPLQPRWGPRPLASSGTVFGAGVDALGRALVITDGTSRFGPGAISAQWFDKDGTPLTDEFALLENFTPGTSTWFETSPLIGGGLLIQRADAMPFGSGLDVGSRRTLQPLAILESGKTTAQPLPDWIRQRADTRLQILPGGRGYAVLPNGADNVPCTQKVEVVAADGTSCGAREYPIASGTCDTGDLELGADGTVIQQLPTAMELHASWGGEVSDWEHSCTWRWWPRAVR